MIEEAGVTQQPAWLDLPDAEIEPKKVQLWSCTGKDKRRLVWRLLHRSRPTDLWISICPTKEEAEANAVLSTRFWKWNGKPATPDTLANCLYEARRDGLAGVRIRAYRNGKWVTVREFPSNVPYFGDAE